MKRIAKWIVLLLVAAFVSATCLRAVIKEREQRRVEVGMTKATVEQILGIPKQHGRVTTNVADGVLIQHTYQGNPSIWYGRLEHYIRVSYLDGRAVEVKRFGL